MTLHLTSIERVYDCDRCNDTGRVTVRTTPPMSYVCAGEPPDYARGVVGEDCYHECTARVAGRETPHA